MIPRLLRGLVGTPAPAPLPLPEGVEVRRGRWLPALGGRLAGGRGPALAVTLGDVIVVHPDVDLSERLLRHELAHVGQWRAQGWFFPVRYAWRWVRHGYRDNPYEVEARNAEGDDARA